MMTTSSMRIGLVLIGLCLIGQLRAGVKEAVGYGSGDDLEQALSVAQGDAVLNAGSKTVFESEALKDKLLKDVGYFSNEVYLVDSAVVEKGESFDGVYARVKIRVTDKEDLSKKRASEFPAQRWLVRDSA